MMFQWHLVFLLGVYHAECVLQNVALGKQAYQPDSYYSYSYARKAVDGSTNQDMFCKSCSLTRQKTNAWWDVDLGEIYSIQRVTIYNRMDGWSERLKDVELYIGISRSSYILRKFQSGLIGSSYTFHLSPEVEGRWVKITRTIDVAYEHLQLCEVQVFAEVGPDYFEGVRNLALGKKAYQPDSYYKYTYAHKAVDGDTYEVMDMGSCILTKQTVNAWWDVDLGKTYLIRNARIFNRVDEYSFKLKDVYLYIGQSRSNYKLKGFHSGQINGDYRFQLATPTLGRWVKITRTSGVNYELPICELQVFGEEVPASFNVQYELIDGQVGTGSILKTKTTTTENVCAQNCKLQLRNGCIAFNYLIDNQQCELLKTFESNAEVTQNKVYYRMIYT